MASEYAAPFSKLRTAYLRAIAKAWNSLDYESQLCAESLKQPRGVLPLLEEHYNFHFPFDVKIVLNKDPPRPMWASFGATEWFGVLDQFTIYLPALPTDRKYPAEEVLARYCAEFPSLLGKAKDDDAEAPPDFAAFGVVTARVLAMAWRNNNFYDALYKGRKLPKDDSPPSPTDSRDLVEEATDYVFPWNFCLTFKEYKPDDGGSSSTEDAYWINYPRSVITLFLPVSPTDVTDRPVALAAYNAAGSPYPFTCD